MLFQARGSEEIKFKFNTGCTLYSDYQRERGVGEVLKGEGEINGDERRPGLGWCTHNTIYR